MRTSHDNSVGSPFNRRYGQPSRPGWGGMAATPDAIAVDRGTASELPPRIVRSRRRRRPSGEPPPLPRQLNTSGRYWLAVALAMLAFSVVAKVSTSVRLAGAVVDHRLLDWVLQLRTPALTRVTHGVGWLATPLALQLAWWANAAVLLGYRRWRHLFVWIGSILTVNTVVRLAALLFQRSRPLGIEFLGPWQGFAMPSLPMAILSAVLVNTAYSLVPRGQRRQLAKAAAAVAIAVAGLSRIYLGQDHPSDALVGVVIGVTIPLLAYRLLVPGDVFPVTYRRQRSAHLDIGGARGQAIRAALQEQLGVVPVDVQPFGWAGSGGSTHLRVKIKGDPESYLFCKLYAANHLRSDRWYKLGRTLLYGGLEDEKAFNSVRRLVQSEDYALRLMQAANLPTPEPYGIVEITPEREYLLVTEFFDGEDAVIDQGLLLVRRLWESGLAHRDIKPANLLVRDGRMLLIDFSFAEVRPSPWRQAVDLANMMLVLALRSDPRKVYERAQVFFTVDEIAEAFAATRGLTMPSQLRRLMRAQGRDLHVEFKRLLPIQISPIAIQRWSWRRVLLVLTAVGVGLVAVLIIAQLLTSPL